MIDRLRSKKEKTKMETRVKETIGKQATGISSVSMTLIGQDNMKIDLVRVTFKNFKDKLRVVKINTTLREQDTFLDNDLTKHERSIQAALRQRARTEREKWNDEVRVRYQKILLHGQWVPWGNLDTRNGEPGPLL